MNEFYFMRMCFLSLDSQGYFLVLKNCIFPDPRWLRRIHLLDKNKAQIFIHVIFIIKHNMFSLNIQVVLTVL